MATLVHDDLIDGARFRRGRRPPGAQRAGAARAAGDYLFARAFAQLSETGDAPSVELPADATLCLARGEALQRRQTHDPDTTVESDPGPLRAEDRCSSRRRGRRRWRSRPLARRVRHRVRHRVPDHRRHPRLLWEGKEPRKIAGVDLREGKRDAAPLLLAAREDRVVLPSARRRPAVRRARRVAARLRSSNLASLALEYADRARACLDGHVHRAGARSPHSPRRGSG